MAGHYAFEGAVLRLTFEGVTPIEDLERLLDAALDDPSCPPRPFVLSDMTESTSVETRTGQEMKDAVGIFHARADRFAGKFAIVTASAIQYGVMRIAGAYSARAGMDLGVFRSEAEALEWLMGG